MFDKYYLPEDAEDMRRQWREQGDGGVDDALEDDANESVGLNEAEDDSVRVRWLTYKIRKLHAPRLLELHCYNGYIIW